MGDYPLSLIFLITPFFDKYYSRRIGRSRTYVIPVTLFLSLFCFFIAPQMDSLVEEKDITSLLVNFLICSLGMGILGTTGEAWILTLYKDENHRSQAANYMYIGQNLGYYIGYNIFIPMNDLDWLNTNIFNNSLTNPILSHRSICHLASMLYGIEFLLVLLVIGERKVQSEEDDHNLLDMYKLLPKHFVNKHMRHFILYTFASSAFYYSVFQSFDYLLVSNNRADLHSSTVTNFDSVAYPFVTTASYLVTHLIRKGSLMKMYHLNNLFNLLVGVFRYLTYLDLINNRDKDRTVLARAFISFFVGCDFTGSFAFGYFNLIVDERFGNTGLSCLASIRSQAVLMSSTVGFYFMERIGKERYIPVAFSLQALSLILLYPYARKLDRKDTRLFDLKITMSIKDLFVHEFEFDEDADRISDINAGRTQSKEKEDPGLHAPPSTPFNRSIRGYYRTDSLRSNKTAKTNRISQAISDF